MPRYIYNIIDEIKTNLVKKNYKSPGKVNKELLKYEGKGVLYILRLI